MQLLRWLLSQPENLSKRIQTSQKILRNLQRSLIVSLGIRGPGGTPGEPRQAILPQFRRVLGGLENQDWFTIDSKHACEVMGFLTPHMHVAQRDPQQALEVPYACHPCTASLSPSLAGFQPQTPDRVMDSVITDVNPPLSRSLSRSLSRTHTPSGLAVIPEYEHNALDPLVAGFGSEGDFSETNDDSASEQLDDYVPESLSPKLQRNTSMGLEGEEKEGVEITDGEITSHPCDFTLGATRHIYSGDRSSKGSTLSLGGELSSSTVCGEGSEEVLYAGQLELRNLEPAETGGSGPPALAEEGVEYYLEDSSDYITFEEVERLQRSRSVGSAIGGRNGHWRQSIGWDFGPESPTDDVDAFELWDCHRSKLEELEDALQRIRM